jgi:hypothetical protein
MACYRRCHERHLLHIFPLFNSAPKSKDKAINKYGDSLAESMNELQEGKTTLSKVGNQYGLSRERIRQLYQIFFDEKYTAAVEKRSAVRTETKNELDRTNQIFENRLNRAKKHCNSYIGIVSENIFNEKCKSLGYVVEMQRGGNVYDAKVNGIPVDIKCCTSAHRTGRRGDRQLYYHFNTTKKQHDAVKFFPFYLLDENAWYIIPVSEVNKISFHLPKYDIEYNGNHRYQDVQKYREAWHLLKNKE